MSQLCVATVIGAHNRTNESSKYAPAQKNSGSVARTSMRTLCVGT